LEKSDRDAVDLRRRLQIKHDVQILLLKALPSAVCEVLRSSQPVDEPHLPTRGVGRAVATVLRVQLEELPDR
jgi:hypothetical protein